MPIILLNSTKTFSISVTCTVFSVMVSVMSLKNTRINHVLKTQYLHRKKQLLSFPASVQFGNFQYKMFNVKLALKLGCG